MPSPALPPSHLRLRLQCDNLLSSRRELIGGVLGLPLVGLPAACGQRTSGSAPWPHWAKRPERLYANFASRRAAEGRDLRSFGAHCDGVSDDSAALERALASDIRVLVIPALSAPEQAIRVTRQLRIRQPILIIGSGAVSRIRWEGPEDDLFLALGADTDPAAFLRDVHIDGIHVLGTAGQPRGHILHAVNVRNASLTRCSSEWVGGMLVNHLRSRLGAYKSGNGTRTLDPAAAAGFSPHADDLNEMIAVHDNRIDGGAYMVHLLRANFVRRAVASGNQGRFANISWWGGGAKQARGGKVDFLRRVRELHIVGNRVGGANGGIYGNNADGVLVADNYVELNADVGIDFEGCFNCVAERNVVRNAGNFGLATFYAARNIVFRDNLVVQDGSAADLHLRFGPRASFGPQRGRAVLALRSSGFGNVEDAITVQVRHNRFVWSGAEGFGNVVPSYCNQLEIADNEFTNVTCDLRYRQTGAVTIAGNRFLFNRAAAAATALLGASAKQVRIADNRITLAAAQPEGSSLATIEFGGPRDQRILVTGNRQSAARRLPILIVGTAKGDSTLDTRGNEAEVQRVAAAQPKS